MITYLTIFNNGYLDFAKNLVLNFKSKEILKSNKLVLYSLDIDSDKEMSNFLKKNGDYNIIHKNENLGIKEFSNFNSNEFYSITQKKLYIILKELLLSSDDNIIHFLDNDVFFIKDPTNIILDKMLNTEICFQQDAPRSHNHSLYHNYVCSGNFSIRKNKNTINFIQKIVDISNKTLNKNDQEILYEFLNKSCNNIKEFKDCELDVYDPVIFQNGYDTFKSNFYKKNNVHVVHTNHMIGRENKIKALKSINCWLYDNN